MHSTSNKRVRCPESWEKTWFFCVKKVEFTLLSLNRNHAQTKQVRPNCWGWKKTQEKREKRGIEREEKGGENRESNRKKKKKSVRIDFSTVTPAPWSFSSKTKTAYTMSKSGLSTFNTCIRRVSKTHRNGFMDDLLTLPPFYVHFVKCLAVLRIWCKLKICLYRPDFGLKLTKQHTKQENVA